MVDWTQYISEEQLRYYAPGLKASGEQYKAILNAGMEMIEDYLDRELILKERTEKYPLRAHVVLKSWPVNEIADISASDDWPEDDTGEIRYSLDDDTGIVRMDLTARRVLAMPNNGLRPYISVTYTAGFSEIPTTIICAAGQLAMAIEQSSLNAGQQIVQQMLDGYQVTYASRNTASNTLESLSPAACIMLAPYSRRADIR